MQKHFELRCVLCGRRYPEGEVEYTCPHCGIDGTLDVLYDYGQVKKELNREKLQKDPTPGMWRYWPVLPVHDRANIPSLAVGGTPLYENKAVAAEYGVKRFFVKDDGRNPTGSLKDRASGVAVARALDLGRTHISCSSTGNAASSLSGFAAVASIGATIFVPEKAPVAKITQLLVYGARVVLVKGDYRDAFDLSVKAIDYFGWYNRNCAINPYLVEGKKTCGLEIAEELGWNVPDYLFVSVGDGCIISSLYKAFYDLVNLGIADHFPKIIGVQAEGCSPIHDAVKSNLPKVVPARRSNTLADSIAVRAPRNWAKALRAVRETGGSMVTVEDTEILGAIKELAESTGVFAEPAGVTAYAGFCKMAAEGLLNSSSTVVVVATGNGLKDISGARKAVGQPLITEPDLDELIKIMN
ncbi:MAG: threonine synthase [Bacillota bacterium]|jgi:threonine synthase